MVSFTILFLFVSTIYLLNLVLTFSYKYSNYIFRLLENSTDFYLNYFDFKLILIMLQLCDSQKLDNKSNLIGFGNQSCLMVHVLTLANLLVKFRYKKNNAFSFSQCIYNWRYVICTVNWVRVQIKMWFNDEPTTTARCKSMYSICIKNEPRTVSNV